MTANPGALPRLVAHLQGDYVGIWCPGCALGHVFYAGPIPDERGQLLGYNGRPTAPRFDKQLSTAERAQIIDVPLCSFSIVAGKISFDAESQHPFRGKTVALPPWPKGWFHGDLVPEVPINRNKIA